MSGAQIGYIPTGVDATFEICHVSFEELDEQKRLGAIGWEPVIERKGVLLMKRRKTVFGAGVGTPIRRPTSGSLGGNI